MLRKVSYSYRQKEPGRPPWQRASGAEKDWNAAQGTRLRSGGTTLLPGTAKLVKLPPRGDSLTLDGGDQESPGKLGGMAKPDKSIGVRRRGRNSFRINYRDQEGNRHFETVEAETIEEAAGIRQARLGDIGKGIPVSSKPNTVLFEELAADVIAHYEAMNLSSKDDIDRRFRLHILPIFGKRKAAQITTSMLNRYIVLRREQGAADGNIKLEMEAMRRGFRLALTSTPPKIHLVPGFPKLKAKVRTGYFERDRLEAICRHLPKHLVPVARFGYVTGWRHEEVITRCWRHETRAGISLDPGETKNSEGRTFPMVQELKKILDSVRPKQKPFPNDRIFTNNGKPIGRFDKAWATACKKAGLPVRYVEKRKVVDKEDPSKGRVVQLYRRGKNKGKPILVMRAAVYFHDFRRTAYRNLVWAGIPEKQARLAVGWLDSKTADRYNVPAKSDMDVIRERFDAAYGANSGAKRTRNGAT